MLFVPYNTDLRTQHLGQTDGRVQTIKIAQSHIQDIEDTLLHEIMHVVDEMGQIGLKEKQIAALASLLLPVLRENGMWRSLDETWRTAAQATNGVHADAAP